MRTFAQNYQDIEFVQEVLAQITWYHNIAIFEKIKSPQNVIGTSIKPWNLAENMYYNIILIPGQVQRSLPAGGFIPLFIYWK